MLLAVVEKGHGCPWWERGWELQQYTGSPEGRSLGSHMEFCSLHIFGLVPAT